MPKYFIVYKCCLFFVLQVTIILRDNEFNKEFSNGSVKSSDSNQLPSNNSIEDTRVEALCNLMPGTSIEIVKNN